MHKITYLSAIFTTVYSIVYIFGRYIFKINIKIMKIQVVLVNDIKWFKQSSAS